MKTTKIFLILLLITFQSCCPFLLDCEDNDDDVIRFSKYKPVAIDRVTFESSVKLLPPVSIHISGKIYVKDNLLFINEVHKGFHIYDNTNPESPIPLQFLEAPGSTDLAIRDNMLYINQATDLIALEYNATNKEISLTKRIINTFPELLAPDGSYPYNVPENSVVVAWKLIN
ncbi:hypothetical protein [Aquimarina sp. MMG016]|uniref:hypothetical protein n=1 Tax=Aquimarina sp. MMG016 TaxID=2822690 RepID=UPI001B39EA50|nr:hypothetical protein [Aquimarina sp. MMG016]MBQ4822375.1 hypothetical protein [Aquimarina sp. MMG016]